MNGSEGLGLSPGRLQHYMKAMLKFWNKRENGMDAHAFPVTRTDEEWRKRLTP
ncbi:MAG: hypothetical protein K0R85_1868, partial [Devosia sp.]|nr:hypothetical protein [Devosia sp.]